MRPFSKLPSYLPLCNRTRERTSDARVHEQNAAPPHKNFSTTTCAWRSLCLLLAVLHRIALKASSSAAMSARAYNNILSLLSEAVFFILYSFFRNFRLKECSENVLLIHHGIHQTCSPSANNAAIS